MRNAPERIIISRTDSIGDVALTLAMAGGIKHLFPDAFVIFLGRSYTKSVIECCRFVDQFANWDEVKDSAMDRQIDFFRALKADCIVHAFPDKQVCRAAWRSAIPVRIATAGRMFSWLTCTHRVFFSRKNSELHESQLNFYLLKPLGQKGIPDLDSVFAWSGWNPPVFPQRYNNLISNDRIKVILHPKSKGSAPEWSIAHFKELVSLLPNEEYTFFLTGTAAEGASVDGQFGEFGNVINLCGQLNLSELIGFVSRCNAMVAASTGPLHLAGLCGINAVGLYSPQPPVHPGRWRPIGPRAVILVSPSHPREGLYLDISPSEVAQKLELRQ